MMPISLDRLSNLNSTNVVTQSDYPYETLRQKALQEAALALGVQSGLYITSLAINKELNQLSNMLDGIYNFNALLLENNIQPPVVVSGHSLSQLDPLRLDVTWHNQIYHIVSESHFVSTALTWRDYLMINSAKPEIPDKSVLPETKEEQTLWRKELSKAWQKGVEQGMDIFKYQLDKLNRGRRDTLAFYMFRPHSTRLI